MGMEGGVMSDSKSVYSIFIEISQISPFPMYMVVKERGCPPFRPFGRGGEFSFWAFVGWLGPS